MFNGGLLFYSDSSLAILLYFTILSNSDNREDGSRAEQRQGAEGKEDDKDHFH
jgi:hypothetical protein